MVWASLGNTWRNRVVHSGDMWGRSERAGEIGSLTSLFVNFICHTLSSCLDERSKRKINEAILN